MMVPPEVQQAANQEPLRKLEDYPVVRKVLQSTPRFFPLLQKQLLQMRHDDKVQDTGKVDSSLLTPLSWLLSFFFFFFLMVLVAPSFFCRLSNNN